MSVQNETIFDNSTLLSNTFLTILDEVKRKFVYQLPIIFTLFGLLGFVGNLFTFLQLPFRYNACCIYTLCGSCIDAINICVNLFPNCLNPANGNLVASIGNSFLCKLKLFVLVFLPQLSMNLLIMSLIDRYICIFPLTSHWRCLLKLETVPWSIGITIIISILMSLYAPILHDVTPGFGCGSINPTLNGIVYILIHGIITPITMVIIVGLTYQRFKQNRLRVGILNSVSVHRFRNQFIAMVFAQAFATSAFALPWIVTYCYFIQNLHQEKTFEESTIVYFVLSLTNNIYYLINVKSFYLSILTSHLFRKTFKTAFRKLLS